MRRRTVITIVVCCLWVLASALVWKKILTSGSLYKGKSSYTGIFYVDGIVANEDDIYVIGERMLSSVHTLYLWKNEALIAQEIQEGYGPGGSFVYGPAVYSNGNVYTADYMDGRVWKNGAVLYSMGKEPEVRIYRIFADGEDIYLAGSQREGSNYYATVWKNGRVLYSYSIKNEATVAIIKDGKDLYYNTGTVIQKNNQALYSIKDGFVRDIALDGQDIYVAGGATHSRDHRTALWKNGQLIFKDNSSKYISLAKDIFICDKKVYLIGSRWLPVKEGSLSNKEDYDTVWRDGEIIHETTRKYCEYTISDSCDVYSACGGAQIRVYKNGDLFYSLYAAP